MSSAGAWLDVGALARALAAGPSSRLATYGSLRPGEQHHDLVADLEVLGVGTIRGYLTDWEGYPVLATRPDGSVVRVVVYGGVTDARWSSSTPSRVRPMAVSWCSSSSVVGDH